MKIIAGVIGLTIALVITSPAKAAAWRSERSFPEPKYALAATNSSDGTIFAIGGASGAYSTSDVQVYRPSSGTWVAGPSLPAVRYRHAAATGGDGRIYAIGGVSPTAITGSVLALKPGPGAAWVNVAPLNIPRQIFDAATGNDGRIYVMGGLADDDANNPLASVEIYSPSNNQWTAGAPMPTPRYGHGVARGGDGRIYAIGGCGVIGGFSDVVEAYSPGTNSWTTVAPLPSKRCNVRATETPEGLIYAIGGCIEKVGGGCTNTRRVDVYSPSLNRWWTIARTLTAHDEGAVATGRQRVYAISGHTAAVESRPAACLTCN